MFRQPSQSSFSYGFESCGRAADSIQGPTNLHSVEAALHQPITAAVIAVVTTRPGTAEDSPLIAVSASRRAAVLYRSAGPRCLPSCTSGISVRNFSPIRSCRSEGQSQPPAGAIVVRVQGDPGRPVRIQSRRRASYRRLTGAPTQFVELVVDMVGKRGSVQESALQLWSARMPGQGRGESSQVLDSRAATGSQQRVACESAP